MSRVLTTPNGTRLQGTLDMIPGIALVDPDDPMDADGTPNYFGGTEVDWNGQTQQHVNGDKLWVDEDGSTWKQSELVWTEVNNGE